MADYKPTDERVTGLPAANYGGEAYPVAAEPPSTDGVVSFLSSNEREGRWPVPRRFAPAVMATSSSTCVRTTSTRRLGDRSCTGMGNIEITVPPDVAVESTGDSAGLFCVKYAKGVNANLRRATRSCTSPAPRTRRTSRSR